MKAASASPSASGPSSPAVGATTPSCNCGTTCCALPSSTRSAGTRSRRCSSWLLSSTGGTTATSARRAPWSSRRDGEAQLQQSGRSRSCSRLGSWSSPGMATDAAAPSTRSHGCPSMSAQGRGLKGTPRGFRVTHGKRNRCTQIWVTEHQKRVHNSTGESCGIGLCTRHEAKSACSANLFALTTGFLLRGLPEGSARKLLLPAPAAAQPHLLAIGHSGTASAWTPLSHRTSAGQVRDTPQEAP